MARIFLSYARDDQARAAQLAAALEDAGHDVWWDRRITGGAEFADAIERALADAEIVVVAWSATAVKSHWVRDEAAAGRDSGRLVPVTLDGTPPPLGFGQVHTIDLSGSRSREGAAELIGAVAAKAEGVEATVSQMGTSLRRRRPWRILLPAALLAALAGAAAWWFLRPPASLAPTVSIARFEAIQPDVPAGVPASLDSEIRSRLSEGAGVPVVEDGGMFVVRGEIRRVGAQLRYLIRIEDRESGTMLWSVARDRPADAQGPAQVAALITSMLTTCGLLDPERPARALSLRGQGLLLTACYNLFMGGGVPGQAVLAAREIVAEAPDFAAGWGVLSQAAGIASTLDSSPESQALRAEAVAAARRGVALDPRTASAFETLAWLEPPGNLLARERYYRQALAGRALLCPTCLYESYSQFLLRAGRFDAAIGFAQQAADRAPGASGPLRLQISANYGAGRIVAGDALLRHLLEANGGSPSLTAISHNAAIWTSRWAEASSTITAEREDERRAIRAALEALRAGDRPAMAQAAAALEALPERPDESADRAILLAVLGRSDAALAALRARGSTRGLALVDLFAPPLRPLWGEPGFAALLEQLGLIRYWRESRSRPDLCGEAGPPRFCQEFEGRPSPG